MPYDLTQDTLSLVCPSCPTLCAEVHLKGSLLSEEAIAFSSCVHTKSWLKKTRTSIQSLIKIYRADLYRSQIATIVKTLSSSKAPLFVCTENLTTEDFRAVVSLAASLDAYLDISWGLSDSFMTAAIQETGMVTATFHEIRQRTDFVFDWYSNVKAAYPCFFNQTLTNVQNFCSLPADFSFSFEKNCNSRRIEALNVLRALVAGLPLDQEQVFRKTGLSFSVWKKITAELLAANYALLLCDESTLGSQLEAELLLKLTAELNQQTRCVILPLSPDPGVTTKRELLTWQTGYPRSLSFSHDSPRYNLATYNPEKLLASQEVDAVFIIGSLPSASEGPNLISSTARNYLQTIPQVFISSQPTKQQGFTLHALPSGVSSAGTLFRCDGVPLRTTDLLGADVSEKELPTFRSALTDILTQLKL